MTRCGVGILSHYIQYGIRYWTVLILYLLGIYLLDILTNLAACSK